MTDQPNKPIVPLRWHAPTTEALLAGILTDEQKANAEGWSYKPPALPGFYTWRKNYQWEPIVRDCYLVGGELVAFASRLGKPLPLKQLGGEWKIQRLTDQKDKIAALLGHAHVQPNQKV